MTTGTGNDNAWTTPEPGVRRRVLADSDEAMSVRFDFEAGAKGSLHNHPHVQTTYVAAGRFDFTINGTTHALAAGDSIVIPSNAEHGCVALEAGSLIDVFVPPREDFR